MTQQLAVPLDDHPAEERWVPVSGYDKYEVSSAGRVRSTKWGREVILKFALSRKGYLQIALSKNNHSKVWRVNTVVLTAFCGPAPHGMQCAHLNGNRTDNRIENLRWVTPRENSAHQIQHGTSRRGSGHACSKLTESKIVEIRSMLAVGDSLNDIGRRFGIAGTTVRNIRDGNTWGHVPLEQDTGLTGATNKNEPTDEELRALQVRVTTTILRGWVSPVDWMRAAYRLGYASAIAPPSAQAGTADGGGK